MSRTAESGHGRRWRAQTGVVASLLVVGVALALPAPQPAAPLASTPAGPTRLTDVWPAAKPTTVAAALPDLSSFHPFLVLDALTIVGIASSTDLTRTKLVIRSPDGATRQLRPWTGVPSPIVAATVAGDSIFWLEHSRDDHGDLVTAWRAGVNSGQAEQLASERTDLLYHYSGYDLQVVDGTLVWAVPTPEGGSSIHSMLVTGGAVKIRDLSGRYALSAWPWVTTSSGSVAGDVGLLNLNTGQRKTVAGAPNEMLSCTPVWCRVTTFANQRQALTVGAERTDGSERRKTGSASLTPINNDVALLDRFELLADAASGDGGNGKNLWLLDLKTGRQVLLDNAAPATTGSRGPFLWWSTGDNETMVWHILDLRQLS